MMFALLSSFSLQEGLDKADKDNEELKNGITSCIQAINQVSAGLPFCCLLSQLILCKRWQMLIHQLATADEDRAS